VSHRQERIDPTPCPDCGRPPNGPTVRTIYVCDHCGAESEETPAFTIADDRTSAFRSGDDLDACSYECYRVLVGRWLVEQGV
jgi:ribosomal protein L37AE/L43A